MVQGMTGPASPPPSPLLFCASLRGRPGRNVTEKILRGGTFGGASRNLQSDSVGTERSAPFNAAAEYARAGATTGVAGSPTQLGLATEGTMCTSIFGIWFMRTTG